MSVLSTGRINGNDVAGFLTTVEKTSIYQNEMRQVYMFTHVTIDDIYAAKEGSAPLPAGHPTFGVCMMLFDIQSLILPSMCCTG